MGRKRSARRARPFTTPVLFRDLQPGMFIPGHGLVASKPIIGGAARRALGAMGSFAVPMPYAVRLITGGEYRVADPDQVIKVHAESTADAAPADEPAPAGP